MAAHFLLMRWGQLLDANGTAILTGTLLVLAGVIYTATRPASKQWLMRKLWQLPSLGRRLHVYQLARFYRSLGMLLRGGMPMVSSLQMVSYLLETSLRRCCCNPARRPGRPVRLSAGGRGYFRKAAFAHQTLLAVVAARRFCLCRGGNGRIRFVAP